MFNRIVERFTLLKENSHYEANCWLISIQSSALHFETAKTSAVSLEISFFKTWSQYKFIRPYNHNIITVDSCQVSLRMSAVQHFAYILITSRELFIDRYTLYAGRFSGVWLDSVTWRKVLAATISMETLTHWVNCRPRPLFPLKSTSGCSSLAIYMFIQPSITHVTHWVSA